MLIFVHESPAGVVPGGAFPLCGRWAGALDDSGQLYQ